MGKTTIEWCDRSINPIRFGRGHYCQKISPGCANCYASRFQPRVGNEHFGGVGGKSPVVIPNGVSNGQYLWLDQNKLREVLRLRKPQRIFWCDMTDLFGSWVPDGWIDLCFATMALTPQHTHQVLTKRADRMAEYFARLQSVCDGWQTELIQKHNRPDASFTPTNLLNLRWLQATKLGGQKSGYVAGGPVIDSQTPWPLPNVWIGVSCEDQKRADERIPQLLRCPAAVRFLSCEPLLGPIRLRHSDFGFPSFNGGLQWVIVGGESGPSSRPCNVRWLRKIVSDCRDAEIACFVKQMGSRVELPNDSASEWGRGGDVLSWETDLANFQGEEEVARLEDRKGGDPSEWPEDLRVRQMPRSAVRT